MAVTSPTRRKRVRLEDVARSVKISIGTASMALRGSTRISSRTRQRVLEACQVMGYRPVRTDLPQARPYTRRETQVGLVLMGDNVHELVNADLLHELSSASHRMRFRLTVQTIELSEWGRDKLVQHILAFARPCTGLLLCGSLSESLLRDIDELHPHVAMLGWPGRDASKPVEPSDEPAGVVIAGDDQAMGRCATQRLLDHGHRRIAFVAGSMPPGASHAKWFEGYRLALADAGISVDADLVRVTGEGEAAVTSAADALAQLRSPPTAYVVTEARVASDLLKAMAVLGRPIGRDAMVIWASRTLARFHGVADWPLIAIDTERWAAAGLTHVLGSQQHWLPRGARVLIPFQAHNLS